MSFSSESALRGASVQPQEMHDIMSFNGLHVSNPQSSPWTVEHIEGISG
jgi:hypothetical protein